MNKKFILTGLFILLVFNVFAQENPTGIDWQEDTLKVKIRKFKLDNSLEIKELNPDTIVSHVEISNPMFIGYTMPLYLGRTISPSISAVFREQQVFTHFYPLYYFQNLILLPKDFVFYKVNRPFSYFYYTGGDKITDNQVMDFVFTANFNSQSNVGMQYRMLTVKDWQVGENSVVSNLRMWWQFQKKKYTFFGNIFFNSIKFHENGGFIDTAKFFNKYEADFFMNPASNTLKYKGLTVFQKYNINDKTDIRLMTEISISNKVYKEKNPDTTFFAFTKQSQFPTYDSTALSLVSNKLQLNFLTGFATAKIGLINEIEKYFYFREYIYGTYPVKAVNTGIELALSGSTGLINYSLRSNYFFTGRKKQDFNLYFTQRFNVNSNTRIIAREFSHNLAANWFLLHYNGNHDQWDNDFKKTSCQGVDVVLSNSNFNYTFGATINTVKNYIYFDSVAKPVQIDRRFAVFTAYLKKQLHIKPFVVETKTYLQKITYKKISLPHLISFVSVFTDFYMFKKALRLNIGVNTYYTDSYYAPSYMPSTNLFYYANENLTGSFPVSDFFISGKIQRASFFLTLKFFNARPFVQYFSLVNHYHIDEYLFLFGVKWWFKD